MAAKKEVRLKVTANLLESKSAEKVPKGAAYAFSSGGRLLAQSDLDERFTTTLTLPAIEAARSVRVMVGPQMKEQELRLSELMRLGAEEHFIRIDPDQLELSVELVVIPDKWLCWLLSLCFVRGTLLKRVVSGGVSIDLPVCNATVEVYEVDPIFIIIPRLPDLIIERIRDFIINPPPPPPPDDRFRRFMPLPPEGPVPSPSPGPRFRSEFKSFAMTPISGDSTASLTGETAARALASVTALQFLARTTNTLQFRQVLIDHVALIRPLFCLFFPTFVTMSLVATATTDECGHFQTIFFRGCNNPDTPDLYFKARQRLFGFFDITIYAPAPIPCFTHWNYVCGTEVTLYTTHPLAVTCSPCPPVIAPNNWVLVMAVGNHPLSLIRGTSVALQPTTDATNLGLTDSGAPFGGLLRLRLEFDNSLREDLEVKYYQVAWRKGTSGLFTPLTDEVHRHYSHEVGGDLILEVFPIGPKPVPPAPAPNLFEIPPALPPIGQWSFPDLLEDLTSAKFPTTVHAPGFNPPGVPIDQAGKYQLKVDLFHADGTPVNIVAEGIKYRVPTSTDLNRTIETEDANALGLVDGNSFIMTLHIDNNVCNAGIDAPTLGGVPASDNCGVLEYDPAAPGSVTMEYTASHPHGFATHSFRLFRGVNLLTPPSVINAPVGTGSFSTTQTVSYLLGGCAVAGFSENLYVAAMTTDGWRRLSEYDQSDVRAFVLAPTPPPEEGP